VIRTAVVLILMAVSAVPASASYPVAASDRQSLASAPTDPGVEERIERAVEDGEAGDLLEIRAELQRLVESLGDRTAPSVRYNLAYVTWRICVKMPDREKKERKRLLKEAQEQLDLVLVSRPEDAEAHALRGSVIGGRIDGPFSGMSLGSKARKSLDRALELDPTNPRVALQMGISYFYTPKAFGGGLEKARGQFERAQRLFEEEPADHPWPNWGRDDVIDWLEVTATSGSEDK
jgi:hypothetical protein